MSEAGHLTVLLNKVTEEESTWNDVLPIVYHQLKAMAHRVKSEHQSGQTLNTTALVHDAFIKIKKHGQLSIQGRQHFYRIAAQCIRQLLVDAARARMAGKRSGERITLDEAIELPRLNHQETSALEIIDIDAALKQLKQHSPRLVQIVEGHFFAGYSFTEVADILNVSESTVMRDWKKARAWLYAHLN
ncbi:ECF-type sigma factor [Marinicella sp. W31]|uniref:ECF-type sigma factor n=1 Tax=Marinicella sp. W31 TaxID=3023713 RepID=UPI003756D4C8